MELLAEGVVQELPCDPADCNGRGYRLIRKNIESGQKVALYFVHPTELGVDLMWTLQFRARGYLRAKAEGFHIIVAGYVGWHPVYWFADEYWGIRNWDSNKEREAKKNTRQRDMDLILSTMNIDKSQIYENIYMLNGFPVDYSLCGLPNLSPKAIAIAKSKAQKRKFITLGPRIRINGFEARDYHSWDQLYSKLTKFDVDMYATCPKHEAAPLPCEHIQDMVGIENNMDLEMAMHSRAIASIGSCTGTAIIMLYSNPANMIIFGGVGGPTPGISGMRDSLSKIGGYKTKLFPIGPHSKEEESGDEAISIIKSILGE